MTRLLLACSAMLFGLAIAAHTTAAGPETGAALHATTYIRTLQGSDGGFPDFADTSTPSATLEAVFAFAAAGIDPRTVEQGTNGPDDYLTSQAASFSSTPGGAAKLVAGLAAMDIDPANFGGVDVLAAMEASYDPASGKYGDDVFAQTLFIFAERSLGRPVPPAAASYLKSMQQADGGWEFCCGFGTDTNATSVAVRALVAAGAPTNDAAVVAGVNYLHASQSDDGGFPYAQPYESDANSTAYVIQAIVAIGDSAEAGGAWDFGGGANPLAKLLSFQNPATGALVAFGADSPFATYQGVAGLMLEAFPEQEEPDAYTATPTSTSTSAATATPTRTRTATATPTRTSTSTPTTTPSAGNTATTSSPTPAPSAVSTVLGSTAAPPHVAPVTALPNAGTGAGSHGPSAAQLALALSGVTMLLAGVSFMRRRLHR